MPAETPGLHIPYPVPDDPVADYPAVGRDLAETIDADLLSLAYVMFTTPLVASNVPEANALPVVTAPAVELDGTTEITVEFACPAIVTGGGTTAGILLYDNGVNVGRLFEGSIIQSAPYNVPVNLRYRFTPAAGSHAFGIRIYNAMLSNFYLYAGTGGAGYPVAGGLRIARAT